MTLKNHQLVERPRWLASQEKQVHGLHCNDNNLKRSVKEGEAREASPIMEDSWLRCEFQFREGVDLVRPHM